MRNKTKARRSLNLTFESQSYVETIVTRAKGKVVDVSSNFNVPNRIDVIFDDNRVIVTLEDGTRGIAKCNPEDAYDSQLGFDIAHNRALKIQINKELRRLIYGDKPITSDAGIHYRS